MSVVAERRKSCRQALAPGNEIEWSCPHCWLRDGPSVTWCEVRQVHDDGDATIRFRAAVLRCRECRRDFKTILPQARERQGA